MTGAVTQIHQEFLDYVYQHFLSTGAWPRTAALEIRFRKVGSAKKIAAQIGRELVIWEESTSGEAVCFLTLRGIASRPSSGPDIENFLAAVRHLGQRYVATEGKGEVSGSEFMAILGLSETGARRVCELIYREGGLTSGARGARPPGWMSFTPSRLTMHLGDVHTIQEYSEICEQFDRDEREAAVKLLPRAWRLAAHRGGGRHADSIAQTLRRLGSERVNEHWRTAVERLVSDPEGAITAAKSLLESVCKHILADLGVKYGERDDLPALCRRTTDGLELAPDQHSEDLFKQILGGSVTVVAGIAALRNRFGDAHGKAPGQLRPARRHAMLAVNLAGAVAAFLVETWLARTEAAARP